MDKSREVLVQALIDAAKNHDWFYEYSDDFRAWRHGDSHRRRICDAYAELEKVDPVLSMQTWNQIAPAHFHQRPNEVR